MHEPFHTCPARKHRDAPSGFHVDRLKCALFAFDVETDGIHDCPGTADSTRYCSIIIYVGTERLDAGNIAGNNERSLAGCREAMRTAKSASCRWRTMRRPRNPVPPNTVTRRQDMSRKYRAALS
jgi:hypothetical protein